MKVLSRLRDIFKKRAFIFLFIAAFSVYAIVTLVNQQMQLSESRSQLAFLNEQIELQELKNEDLQSILDSSDEEMEEYIERLAREELDLANKGDRIFINISGD